MYTMKGIDLDFRFSTIGIDRYQEFILQFSTASTESGHRGTPQLGWKVPDDDEIEKSRFFRFFPLCFF